MFSKSLTLAIVAAPIAFVPPLAASATGQRAPGDMAHVDQAPEPDTRYGCPNTMDVEPIVMLNVSGSTLLGPVQYNLIVYSNGQTMFIRSEGFPTGGGGDSGLDGSDPQQLLSPVPVALVQNLMLSEIEVDQLVADLRRAGAQTLCDQEVQVTDVPLQTLTILEARADAVAHTFSYWGGVGDYADVAQTVDSFIATYFPGM